MTESELETYIQIVTVGELCRGAVLAAYAEAQARAVDDMIMRDASE